MKRYTDLKQSKKLAEFLPLERADIWWAERYKGQVTENGQYIVAEEPYYYLSLTNPSENNCSQDTIKAIPCWSLAALLNIIPQEIFDGEYIINITEGCDNRWVLTYDHYENRKISYYGLSTGADNLVDACYEMILKLHKRKML